MNIHFQRAGSVILTLAILAILPATPAAADDKAELKIEMAGGRLLLTAPEAWQRKEPKFGIIQHEFAVPASAGDGQDGRVTIMGALGGVEANVERWYGQFVQPDGSSTREKAKQETFEAAGQKVHLVDLSGTYLDRPRPAAPAVERENYRMLAGIIESQKYGLQFIKFYGPRQTVSDHEEAFGRMLKQLKVQ
jgi:hypothetical protein